MELIIQHQDSYSRGELLLRTFFGWLYILIPHAIALWVMGIVAAIISFIAFWAVLFTGKYPKGMFDFMVGVLAWGMRVQASFMNLVDGYPEFGLDPQSGEKVKLSVEYPESLRRGLLLLRVFLGWLYVGIPHVIVLWLRMIVVFVILFLAWWVVLFTGNYPESWHNFVVGTYRWSTRVALYMSFMTDVYPPFSAD
jgi:hypothetical protein